MTRFPNSIPSPARLAADRALGSCRTLGCWQVFTVSIGDCRAALRDGRTLGRYFDAEDIALMRNMGLEKRCVQWCAGRVAAKSALQRFCGGRGDAAANLAAIKIRNVEAGPHRGQPRSNTAGCVSISHSGRWAVAVADHRNVGVDVERIQAFGLALRDMATTRREREWIGAAGEREADLRTTLVWSFKEAFLKAHGLGVFGRFKDVELTGMDADGKVAWSVSESLGPALRRLVPGSLTGFAERMDDHVLAVVCEAPGEIRQSRGPR
jgi:4'-phosphopantetheinyl transferase EntD